MATFDVKAWTYDGPYPSGLKITTVQTPRANDIKSLWTTPHMLVKLRACALNPVDIQMMNLLGPSWIPGLSSSPKSCVCDFSGQIVAGGRTGFIQHEEVFGITLKPHDTAGGALAEMSQFNMANSCAVKKPANWSHEQAAAVPLVWLTARTCIEKVTYHVESSASKRVAILGGSSATGIYTTLIAKRRGWKVITTSSSRNKDFVTNTLKADAHVDYATQNVRAEVEKFGPVAVIDCVGGTDCIGLPSSKQYVTIVGDKTSRASMGGPYTYYNFFSYHAPLQWIRWAKGHFGYGESYDVVMLELKTEWLQEAVDTLTTDEIFIDSTFGFSDAKKAFEKLNTGRARGKVVVKIQD
ncbi:hypothetical protein B0A50_03921 [Salinomyces thailandicus]|uniref:Enoyl reductase (ER) domain-containing protein n=1 Tax=Salinomyces thailandicus TaxID=706561 RepID=A0A4U0U186_9PEZI|nr:hypothetical protein B0A50_03921 [Salinomyces thailandica]